MLRDRLPETTALAIVGRRLGDVLDHALLDGRDYTIVDTSPFSDGFGTLIHFAAEPRPWVPPWAR